MALHLDVADASSGALPSPGVSFSDTVIAAIHERGDTAARATIAGALAGLAGGSARSRAVGVATARRLAHAWPSGHDIVSLRGSLSRWPVSRPRTTSRSPGGPHVALTSSTSGASGSPISTARPVRTRWCPGAHVISLSRVGGPPQQPHWRRFYLVDSEDPDDNIALDAVIDDVMSTVTACIGAGEPVVVHCFAGESRTGLVLHAGSCNVMA